MNINNIYKNIQKRSKLWNYYNKDILVPDILDASECETFIKNYIKASEKASLVLVDNVSKIKNDSPQRMTHIVSTFFLGLWLYNNKFCFIRKHIREEISSLRCFLTEDDINQQFTYVWFMATIFHDLGYPAELKGASLPNHEIPAQEHANSIPDFYKEIYIGYYKYRNNKEHGIFAGLKFDEDICKIRNFQEYSLSTELSWRKELDLLYHYVAWIILAHNIWLVRDDNKYAQKYRTNALQELILSSEKDDNGKYLNYKFSFDEYPLFAFFCIIDTIEPTKITCTLSTVDIKLGKGGDIIVKSNDKNYLEKVNSLNEWLVPTTMEENTVLIHLNS